MLPTARFNQLLCLTLFRFVSNEGTSKSTPTTQTTKFKNPARIPLHCHSLSRSEDLAPG